MRIDPEEPGNLWSEPECTPALLICVEKYEKSN